MTVWGKSGFCGLLLASLLACGGPNPGDEVPNLDTDSDAIPDDIEDRNRNGMVDPGETNPASNDTDGDGILDGEEVSTQACGPQNDRAFMVYDVPGADAEVLVDAEVSVHGLLYTFDARNPGAVFFDPSLDVAAAVISKQPEDRDPAAQRAYEMRTALSRMGQTSNPRVRSFTTVQGFQAEQARFTVRFDMPLTASAVVNQAAGSMMQNISLQGSLPEEGLAAAEFELSLLTVSRGAGRVVLMIGATAKPALTEASRIRLEELTDGTNLARRGSFTRHVCDPFIAEKRSKADILWVVDDSGSMEDDQMAVMAASTAMADVLNAAQVDFRLGVARMFADRPRDDARRGRLEGDGFTADIAQFQRDIVVGADGGWEPGLQVGIDALERATPRTAPDEMPDPERLRADAATIVIHLSDERDQHVECAACGACDGAEGEARSCTEPEGQVVIDEFIARYQTLGAVSFALVGDLPNGCNQGVGRDDSEPGQGYAEVAAATGGQFGSICGDMQQNVQDVARVAIGVSSIYQLNYSPASATLKVAVGQPGQGHLVPRDGVNGFDYDPVHNTIVFYGDANPEEGDEVVVAYRRWDWANNTDTPADPCDECVDAWCNPELDYEMCQQPCGEVYCDSGLTCLPHTAVCGDPNDLPVPSPCGECDAGLVCDPSAEECIPPCEQTGCASDEMCNHSTHLCGSFGV